MTELDTQRPGGRPIGQSGPLKDEPRTSAPRIQRQVGIDRTARARSVQCVIGPGRGRAAEAAGLWGGRAGGGAHARPAADDAVRGWVAERV